MSSGDVPFQLGWSFNQVPEEFTQDVLTMGKHKNMYFVTGSVIMITWLQFPVLFLDHIGLLLV